ncbi:hypothetical protein GCM10022221_35520 [Actinocorallia aurea]
MRSISDDDLIKASRQTDEIEAMSLYEDELVMGNGNHRMRELLKRADSPNSIITDDTPIYILGF